MGSKRRGITRLSDSCARKCLISGRFQHSAIKTSPETSHRRGLLPSSNPLSQPKLRFLQHFSAARIPHGTCYKALVQSFPSFLATPATNIKDLEKILAVTIPKPNMPRGNVKSHRPSPFYASPSKFFKASFTPKSNRPLTIALSR